MAPAGIIKFSVMPAGIKFRFSHELMHQFFMIFLGKRSENEAEYISLHVNINL